MLCLGCCLVLLVNCVFYHRCFTLKWSIFLISQPNFSKLNNQIKADMLLLTILIEWYPRVEDQYMPWCSRESILTMGGCGGNKAGGFLKAPSHCAKMTTLPGIERETSIEITDARPRHHLNMMSLHLIRSSSLRIIARRSSSIRPKGKFTILLGEILIWRLIWKRDSHRNDRARFLFVREESTGPMCGSAIIPERAVLCPVPESPSRRRRHTLLWCQ